MSNLQLRAITGTLYVAVIVGAIYAGPVWFGLLCMLFGLGAILEFTAMTGKTERPDTIVSLERICTIGGTVLPLLAGVVLVTVSAMKFPGFLAKSQVLWIVYLLSVILAGVFVGMRVVLTLFDKQPGALQRLAYSILGMSYVTLPLLCLMLLQPTTMELPHCVLMLFVMIWLNDTGAYLVGSRIGRRKLCERLSPKKSWEGFWGGLIFSAIAGMVYFGIEGGWSLGAVIGLIIGATVSVAATLGDLFESLIKRTVGVKDSGKAIPGHGGILDRIDSLLFAAPVMFILMIFFDGLI